MGVSFALSEREVKASLIHLFFCCSDVIPPKWCLIWKKKLKPINSTIRKADDNIYLNENRYEKPKEVFKELVKIVRQEFDSQDNKVFLDAGCATGELIWYGKSQFPQSAFTGLDVSPEMIKSARRKLTDCKFFVGSVLDSNIFETETFDAITCSGVLSIFDDQKTPIQNMISGLGQAVTF